MCEASEKTSFVVSESGGFVSEICLVVCTPAVSARRTLRAQRALGPSVLDLGALALLCRFAVRAARTQCPSGSAPATPGVVEPHGPLRRRRGHHRPAHDCRASLPP